MDPEFTRSQLFLIAEILGKIKRSDVQREVEIIRDKLFEAVENSSAANNETAEANHTPKLPRANAKVTVEDVREIRSRSALGESNSDLAKEFNKKREKKTERLGTLQNGNDSRDSGRDSGKGCGVADKHNGVQTVKLA